MGVLPPILIGSLVLSVAFGSLAAPSGADAYTDAGISWLLDQQRDDGSFELADFPGFETPDAVLAIAADAQTTSTWSTSEALAAVEAAESDLGATALDWLDDWVDGAIANPFPPPAFLDVGAGQRAKLILQVAGPLGLDPADFDPAADSAEPVDLTAGLDTIAPAVFNSFLFGRLAESGLDQNVHQRDLQLVCEAQHAGGGWGFDGLPAGTDPDLDTSGFAIMTLVAAGVPTTDAVLTTAAGWVDGGQQLNGAWQTPPTFGPSVDDPNATALALMADAALGGTADVDLAVTWLQGEQLTMPPADHGRFASPNDGFGVNTFATTQAIQALLLDQAGADWLPRPAADSGRRCIAPDTYTDVPADAWYDDGARWVDDEDIVSGTNGALLPRDNVNRAQASMWLNLVFGGPGGDPHAFVDVRDGAWYEDGVNFVDGAPNGRILTGASDRFRPRVNLNRAQAAAWLYAAAGSPDVTGLPAHGFTDVGGDAWYRHAVTWAKASGIVSGFGNNTFRGLGEVNRAQLTQWMFNLGATPEAWEDGAVLPPTALFTAAP